MGFNTLRYRAKRWIPEGSGLWYPFFVAKRALQSFYDPNSVQAIRWYVVHQNILIDEYKAIYLPIPKVACSTLKLICADLLNMTVPSHDVAEEIHLLHFPCAKKYKIRKHYRDYFKFAFVRNPWSRLVSCYNDKLNYDRGHIYDRYDNSFVRYLKKMDVFSERMSFDHFVEVICDIPDEEAEAHFRSQYRFISDERGCILTDFIGRFECLEEDFKTIAAKLEMKTCLPHLRPGKPRRFKSRSYREYFTRKTTRLVERRYERDLELFGYKY